MDDYDAACKTDTMRQPLLSGNMDDSTKTSSSSDENRAANVVRQTTFHGVLYGACFTTPTTIALCVVHNDEVYRNFQILFLLPFLLAWAAVFRKVFNDAIAMDDFQQRVGVARAFFIGLVTGDLLFHILCIPFLMDSDFVCAAVALHYLKAVLFVFLIWVTSSILICCSNATEDDKSIVEEEPNMKTPSGAAILAVIV